MKNLFNKYFDFIGIENEGYRRLSIIGIVLFEISLFIIDGDNIIDESFLLQTLDWSKTNPKAVHRW